MDERQGVQAAVDLVDEISAWVDDIPPIQQPMRFGNKAFRDFYDRVVQVQFVGPLAAAGHEP